MTGQQPYEVAEHWDSFELRRYLAHLAAEIDVIGSFDEAPVRALGPLAGYIKGANRSRRRIAMAAPVTQQAAGPGKDRDDCPDAPAGRRPAGPLIAADVLEPQRQHEQRAELSPG